MTLGELIIYLLQSKRNFDLTVCSKINPNQIKILKS